MSLATAARHESLLVRFDPRRNSLSVLRLALAAIVALVHAQAIGWGVQPTLGRTDIGELAVDAFFVISGFLVTRSALRLPGPGRFLWHRFLRIMPGFWACLLVTAFVAAPLLALAEGRSPLVVLTAPQSGPGYVLNNAALLIRQWDVAELGGTARSMNGSLWTLFYEVLCYLVAGALVTLGLTRSTRGTARRRGTSRSPSALRGGRALLDVACRRAPLLITLGVWALLALDQSGRQIGPDYLPRFLFMFLLGALALEYAERIRISPALLTAAAVLLTGSLWMEQYRVLGGVAFAYLLMWAVVALPAGLQLRTDLSYGVYVYHWPVGLLLAQVMALPVSPLLGAAVLGPAVLAITALVAFASWHLVEQPALRHKNAWARTPSRPG